MELALQQNVRALDSQRRANVNKRKLLVMQHIHEVAPMAINEAPIAFICVAIHADGSVHTNAVGVEPVHAQAITREINDYIAHVSGEPFAGFTSKFGR